ncbi:MAG: hypothetical protein AAF439_12230 [Pseudomonadota bacterium]
MELGRDPIDVVLRQDRAYGPDGCDIDLWMSTLTWPLTLRSGADQVVLPDYASIVSELGRVTELAQREGVVRMQTRILSHLRPADDTVILSSIKDRFDADDKLIGSSSMTWTLVLLDSDWKIRQLSFERSHYGLPSIPSGG